MVSVSYGRELFMPIKKRRYKLLSQNFDSDYESKYDPSRFFFYDSPWIEYVLKVS